MPDRKSLSLLQYGRGLAAIAVVAFHLSLLLGDPRYLGRTVFHDITWRGNLGVDFFFVLSGFIIFYAHERDIGHPERLRTYLAKRFTRLYPVYWVYSLGLIALLLAGIGSAAAFPHGITDWLSMLLLVRFGPFELPITPAWSLIHEVGFYALFAILILSRRWGMALLAVWAIALAAFGTYAPEGGRTAFNTYFSAFNLDFLVGIAAYYVWKQNEPKLALPCIVSGALLFAGYYLTELRGTTFYYHPLAYAVAFGLIIAGAATLETHRRLRPVPLLRFLGDASYSIYLTHLAILGLSAKITIAAGRHLPLPDWSVYVTVLSAAIVGGSLAHVLVEKPLVRLVRTRKAVAATGTRHVMLRSSD